MPASRYSIWATLQGERDNEVARDIESVLSQVEPLRFGCPQGENEVHRPDDQEHEHAGGEEGPKASCTASFA